MNEQWNLEGNCAICRRANYCSKDCKARKKRKNAIIKEAFVNVMEEKNPGCKALLDKIDFY